MSYVTTAEIDQDPSLRALDATLAGDAAPERFREALAAASSSLTERFRAGESVVELVRLRSGIVDRLLVRLWRQHAGPLTEQVALVAVGGYGRRELQPCSDIDVMLLLGDDLPDLAPSGEMPFYRLVR